MALGDEVDEIFRREVKSLPAYAKAQAASGSGLAPPVDEMNQLLMGLANAAQRSFHLLPTASKTCRRPETSVDCLGCRAHDSGWCASFRTAIEGRLLGLGRSIPARAAGCEQLRASARGHSSPRPTSYSGRRCADSWLSGVCVNGILTPMWSANVRVVSSYRLTPTPAPRELSRCSCVSVALREGQRRRGRSALGDCRRARPRQDRT